MKHGQWLLTMLYIFAGVDRRSADKPISRTLAELITQGAPAVRGEEESSVARPHDRQRRYTETSAEHTQFAVTGMPITLRAEYARRRYWDLSITRQIWISTRCMRGVWDAPNKTVSAIINQQ
jgi:hypothetical protein